jgi:hypothetical protein
MILGLSIRQEKACQRGLLVASHCFRYYGETPEALTRETVFIAQQRDAHCKELITEVRAGTEPGYLISEYGLLYVGQELEHVRLVVPAELTRSIIELHHDKVFAGH